MAHNINRHATTGKDAFFSVQEKAWHGLGQIVQDYPTSAEAIIFAGLDFEVIKKSLFIEGNEEIKTHFATVRTDTNQVLGVVGSKYEIVQNKTAFTFFDTLTANDSQGIKYETAGALGNGERIFITAKMPDYMKIGRNDKIEKYIFLTTSHDGSGAIMAAFTPVRIVCNNTLNMALKNHSNAVTIKHTANAEEYLKAAARIISISNSTAQIMEDMFNQWAKIRVNDRELKKLISLAMAPNKEIFNAIATKNKEFEFSSQFKNICEDVFSYAMNSPTQQMETTQNTVFGAYNAVTGFYQNVKGYKNADSKLNSIMFGTALDRTKTAFEVCNKAAGFLN